MLTGYELQFSNEIDTTSPVSHAKQLILQGDAILTLQTEHALVNQNMKASTS